MKGHRFKPNPLEPIDCPKCGKTGMRYQGSQKKLSRISYVYQCSHCKRRTANPPPVKPDMLPEGSPKRRKGSPVPVVYAARINKGEDLNVIPTRYRAEVALRKIQAQFPPEGRLMYAIIEQAVRDAFGGYSSNTGRDNVIKERFGALDFLAGEMWPAEISGVDSDWIRYVLSQVGLKVGRVEVAA